jgi:tRNA-intron endonuclease
LIREESILGLLGGREGLEDAGRMITGELRGRRLRLLKDDVDSRLLKDYGEVKKKYIYLDPLETLYLVLNDKVQVASKGRILTFDELMESLRGIDPDIFSRFIVYRDLRSRGYVVKPGYGEAIDFLLYDRGDYPDKPAKYRVIGVDEGHPITTLKLIDILRFTIMGKKELKIAVIERRGDVVYYTLKQFMGGRLGDLFKEEGGLEVSSKTREVSESLEEENPP